MATKRTRVTKPADVGGASKKVAPLAAKPRSETKNINDPRGRFGKFLRNWIDKHYSGDEKPLAKVLGVSERAIRKWCEGSNGPTFESLDRVAVALGFEDWGALGAAVRKFHAKK